VRISLSSMVSSSLGGGGCWLRCAFTSARLTAPSHSPFPDGNIDLSRWENRGISFIFSIIISMLCFVAALSNLIVVLSNPPQISTNAVHCHLFLEEEIRRGTGGSVYCVKVSTGKFRISLSHLHQSSPNIVLRTS
jgi:hypothetical protein